MGIGVDTDDVFGLTETAGVLYCTANAEGDIQIRIDDNTSGANLAFVIGPTAIGNHAGNAH